MTRLVPFVLCLTLLFSAVGIAASPQVNVRESDFDFGRALKGTVVEHAFVLNNSGSAPVTIDKVRLTPPLTLLSAPATLLPGAEGVVRVRLDTTTLAGLFEGRIELSNAGSDDAPIGLTFTGTVYRTVEAAPHPAFFVVAERGKPQEQSLELISHEPGPVEIEDVSHPDDRFTTRLDTIEPGKRYRLTLRLDGSGNEGRQTDAIVVKTSSRVTPVVKIAANTLVRERVYTFPDVVDLGRLPINAIQADPSLLEKLAQTLMVYRKGTDNFEVGVTTSLDPLDVRAERGPLGDRWQLTIALKRGRLKPGPLKGTIVIETNDPEFRILRVPVIGLIVAN